jgi:hypothetical protein
MRRVRWVAAVALLAVVAGCGSAGNGIGAGSGGSSARGTGRIAGGCPVASAVVRHARVLVRADLDGDGRADTLAVTGPHGACRDTLVAHVGDRVSSLRLGGARLDPASVTLVQLPGRRGLLVGARQAHPRGGFQVHLFGYGSGRLRELLDRHGNPLVPFVATDAGATPVSAGCGHDALVVEQAVTHRRAGLVPTWDVRRTSYTVSGAQVTGERSRTVASGLTPARLRQRFPDLAGHVLFRDCAAAAPLTAS